MPKPPSTPSMPRNTNRSRYDTSHASSGLVGNVGPYFGLQSSKEHAMPIYMKITQNGLPIINGDVTAKGHEKWIALTAVQLGSQRPAGTSDGASGQKEAGKSVLREIVFTKMQDSASRPLIMATMTPPKGDTTVQIDFVKPDQKGESTYLTITLQEVIITGYYMGSSFDGRQPSEQFTLNFTKITYNSIAGVDTPPNTGWKPLHP
jgi:type VI secretion system Hcp family effector